jgi:hypothetical protein
VLTASIIRAAWLGYDALMMEAANTPETSVNLHQTTRRNIQKTAILIQVVRDTEPERVKGCV